MKPTPEFLAQLDSEDIAQARAMTPTQKLRAGGDLFDDACRWTLAGIRKQFPGLTPMEALNELRRRLSLDEKETFQ